MAMEVSCRMPNAHSAPLLSIAYNKDRKEIYSGSEDTKIKVWDVETGRLLRTQQGHQAWVTDLLYSTTASLLFSSSLDGNILVWSDRGKLLQMVGFGGPIHCLAWDPKGKFLIAGGKNVVQLYKCMRSSSSMYIKSDSQNQKIGIAKFLIHATVLYTHDDVIQSICTSDRGDVFTSGFDRCICIFDSAKPGGIKRLSKCHEGAISAAAYDKDTKSLITGSYDGCVKLWSHEGHCLDIFANIIDCVTSITYIPQTHCYWVTGKESYPIVIDAMATSNVTDWVADTCSFRDLRLTKVFHPPTTDIALGLTSDREIIVWRYNQFGPHRVLQGHSDWVETVLVAHRNKGKMHDDAVKATNALKKLFPHLNHRGSGDGETFIPADIEVYSGGGDGALLKWQTDRSSKAWTLTELCQSSQHSITCMIYHKELDVVITGSQDSKIRVWNLDGHPPGPKWKKGSSAATRGPDVLRGHTGKVTAIAACYEDILISASHDMSLRWWDLKNFLPMEGIEMAHDVPVQYLEFSPERNMLASCAGEPSFRLWNVRKMKRIKTVQSEVGNITIVKWCNVDDGYWITAADEGTIALWDPDTLTPIRSICYRREPVTALLLDEVNMLLLVSMQSDHAIRAFRLDLTGDQVCTFTGHTEQVHSLAHLGNLNQYISGSWDKSIRTWLVPQEPGMIGIRLRQSIAKIDTRDLTNQKEAEFAPDAKYVSSYEREHPLVVPKQLQDLMNGVPSYKPLFSMHGTEKFSPSRSKPQSRQPPLVYKLAALEKSLNDKIK